MVSLFDPIYPPLASPANITGDVELTLGIRNDGVLNQRLLLSGRLMLREAALDSARKSRFKWPGCREQVTSYSLTYSFRLVAGPDFSVLRKPRAGDPIAEPHNRNGRTARRSSLLLKRLSSLPEMPVFMEMRFPLGWGELLFLSSSFREVS
jgi:hypothetical protein